MRTWKAMEISNIVVGLRMTMLVWETLEKMDEYENIIFAIQ